MLENPSEEVNVNVVLPKLSNPSPDSNSNYTSPPVEPKKASNLDLASKLTIACFIVCWSILVITMFLWQYSINTNNQAIGLVVFFVLMPLGTFMFVGPLAMMWFWPRWKVKNKILITSIPLLMLAVPIVFDTITGASRIRFQNKEKIRVQNQYKDFEYKILSESLDEVNNTIGSPDYPGVHPYKYTYKYTLQIVNKGQEEVTQLLNPQLLSKNHQEVVFINILDRQFNKMFPVELKPGVNVVQDEIPVVFSSHSSLSGVVLYLERGISDIPTSSTIDWSKASKEHWKFVESLKTSSSSAELIVTAAALPTVTPPKPQYTPLPTPGSSVSFVPDQAFIDSLPQIDSPPRLDTPDEYPKGWPNDLKLFPNNDSLRYVANVINKDVGFSVVLSMQYISSVFRCTNNEIDVTICAGGLISRIKLSKDNPFSFSDPTKWLLLSDAQQPHVVYKLISTKGSLYQYKFTPDTYNKGPSKDGTDLWTQPGIDYSKINTPTLDVPWKYFSALSFGCQYSCPRQSSVFVDENDPHTVFIVGYYQNGPFTQDITGRAFDYTDTFRILPKN